ASTTHWYRDVTRSPSASAPWMSTRSCGSSVTSAGLILADRTEGGWLPEGPPPDVPVAGAPVELGGVAGGSAVQLHRKGRTESAASTRKRVGRGWISVIG